MASSALHETRWFGAEMEEPKICKPTKHMGLWWLRSGGLGIGWHRHGRCLRWVRPCQQSWQLPDLDRSGRSVFGECIRGFRFAANDSLWIWRPGRLLLFSPRIQATALPHPPRWTVRSELLRRLLASVLRAVNPSPENDGQ